METTTSAIMQAIPDGEINWTLIITIILGSSVVATVVTKIWETLQIRHEEEKEQHQKLYGPLRLYFSYLDSVDFHLKEIVQVPNIQTREKMGKLGGDNRQTLSEYSIRNKMVEEWWRYVDIIKQLLERNPGLIKQKHEQFVHNFIKGYVARQHFGKIHYERNVPDYLRKYFNKGDEIFIQSVNKLKNVILEK